MSINNLKPDPKNPRKITDTKLEMLKASIKEFGDLSGIIFNKRTGQLISGHQRKKIIPEDAEIVIEKVHQVKTPAGTIAEGYIKLGTESMRYREVDVDIHTQTAMNIAANKHSGDWDIPKLNEILLDLDAANYDLSLTGFTDTELENLLAPTSLNKDEKVEDQTDVNFGDTCPHCGEAI